jgi:transcriptional regulator with XRE-family HTH domain
VANRRDVTLGSFVRARRAALNPADLGFGDSRTRRVPGLRREELAVLASVSVDYIVGIEQGRRHRVSRQVLTALAGALRLSHDQRTYMFALVGAWEPATADDTEVPPHVRQLVRDLDAVPALILNHRWEVLCWNALAAALMADFAALPDSRRNLMRLAFLDPEYRSLFGTGWARTARSGVAMLRLEAAHHPDDAALTAMVRELSAASREFAAWWHEQAVSSAKARRKIYYHPLAGQVAMDVQPFAVKDRPDLSLMTYTAAGDARSQQALRSLTTTVRYQRYQSRVE